MKITKTSVCPVCGDRLNISKLSCPSCKAEFPVEEKISEYDRLDAAQSDFLRTFLTCRGNMKDVQNKIGTSYPTAKKRLDELLKALGIADNNVENRKETVNAAMLERADDNSINASDIIKNKLIDCGGIATVRSVSGNSYMIHANADGNSFTCDELPITPPYKYCVFDKIIELLFRNGGRARKGNGRNFKLGYGDCTEDTIVGCIAKEYFKKTEGISVVDPVFVLSAILDWAGIAHNERGYLELTADYRTRAEGR